MPDLDEAKNAPEASGAKPAEKPAPEKAAAPMRWLAWLFALSTLAGLIASSILVVDYLRPIPVYCEEGGGCDAIKHTQEAMSFGVPTPLLGVAGFLLLGLLILIRGRFARLALVVVASIAGAFGGHLLTAQVGYDVYCKYCLVADFSSLAIMAGSSIRLMKHWDWPGTWKPRAISSLTLLAAAILPMAFGFTRKVPVPDAIAKEIAATPPGTVTVVDFVDWECPFCRRTNVALEPILAANASRIRLVRRQVPLQMHPHAMDAARAACCGEKLGKGDEMTMALLTTDVENLTPDGCSKLASGLGLQSEAYSACVQDPSTQSKIDADIEEFHAAKGAGLPTIWVNDTPLFGEQTKETLEEAVQTALAKTPHAG
jgi:protein-disulfide isomerase/uncharacterized membrane protein